MKHSETINELAAALAKAQAELKNPTFDAVNPHFKSKFASLANVRDTVVPILSKHGISVTQWPENDEGKAVVTTMLTHSSGQWMSSTFGVPASKADAQGFASAVTYARRYSLMACTGVVGDTDDDGNAASNGRPSAPPPPALDLMMLEAEIAEAGGDRDKLTALWKKAVASCNGDVALWNKAKTLFPSAKKDAA